ncbi:Protein CBG12549 [Caenorhabditis briggsae]|uniref:Protein CBG12549 n=1 Tax=Caenorhabditis briggsae TaxID=6238 RepID=A8XG06_CAEBR|nr:Protein CBG12549 [Caenorhabditis briggsae]CAP31511.2 Protein CBG12549 [Caenorhabditis briggsae]
MPDDKENSRIHAKKDTDSEPKSLIFAAGTPINRDESLEQLREFVTNLGKSEKKKNAEKPKKKQGYFMGFLTQDQAEKWKNDEFKFLVHRWSCKIDNSIFQEVVIPAQFATYYRIDVQLDSSKPQKDSNISLNLFVCYLNSRNRYHHYPIIKKEGPTSRALFQLGHFSITKISNEPIFSSIKSLLKHYTQFVYIDSITETGGIEVSVFPK